MVQFFIGGELVKTHPRKDGGKQTDCGDYPPEKIETMAGPVFDHCFPVRPDRLPVLGAQRCLTAGPIWRPAPRYRRMLADVME
jgi:hypothetical protein